MKGNKMKVNEVPSAYTLWLARLLHQSIVTGRKQPVGGRVMKKGKATFGFSRMASKMMRLGYSPKYARYPSRFSWFD